MVWLFPPELTYDPFPPKLLFNMSFRDDETPTGKQMNSLLLLFKTLWPELI